MKKLETLWAKLRPLCLFLQRHMLVVFFVLSALLTVTFYYDVVFLGKTMLSPGGLTAGVLGDYGAYGDVNPLPADFSKFAAFMKDLGSNAWAGEPQVAKAAEAIRNFDLPLWNDNAAVGKPLAANFLSSAFYPLKLILYAMPNVHGWEVYLLARFGIAVFFFFLFLRELNIKPWPAFLGGVAFAFSGYFVMLQNIQNMDVDLLAPVMFWVVAYAMNVAKQERIRWIQYVMMVGALSVVFLSNIPESLILVLAAGFLFWAYRLFALYRSKDKDGFTQALRLALQIVIPVGLIVLPLYMVNLEFLQHAITTHERGHEVGTSFYVQPNYVAFYVLPYIQNVSLLITNQPVNGNAINYIGMVAYFLVLAGVVTVFKYKSSRLFLLILGIITVAKIHGVPLIHEVIGSAPGFDRVMYMKYAQPIVSVCAASFVAFGLEALWERKIKPWQLLVAVMTGLLLLWQAVRMLPGFDMSRANVLVVLLVFGLLLALAFLVLSSAEMKWRVVGATALGVLLIAELWNFIPRNGRPQRYETFTQPPFVSFLKTRQEPYRIYAYDGLLYPDISSGFNLDDIRDLDGVMVGNYVTYVRHFISHSFIDRFTGKKSGPGESIPALIVNNPFIDILNVKYFVAQNPPLDLYPENKINNIILSHNPPTPSLREAVFDIHADMRRVLFEHSPGVACAPLPVTKQAPLLRFSYGIDEQAWTLGGGDGVQFVVTGPSDELLFEAKINPAGKPSDQTWFDQSIDLSAYAGTEPKICFYSNPIGDTIADWGGWADLRLTSLHSDVILAEQTQVKLVYRGTDAYVYENLHATNRMFTVGQVTSFQAEWDMIKYMRRPEFDPTTEAVILTEADEPTLPELDGDTCQFETVQDYQESKSSLVSVDVYSPGTCLLVWSDTDYPGWNAYVDGQKAHIYNTDLMLRGIVLTQGKHHIVMQYRPLSFYASLLGTLVGLGLTAFWAVRFARKPSSPKRTGKKIRSITGEMNCKYIPMDTYKAQGWWLAFTLVSSLVVLAGVVIYILTDGLFDLGREVQFGSVFPEMWTRLLHLDVTADPETIGGEAFVIGDKRIAYFLPLPALVRGILSLVGLGHSAVISVSLGALLFAACSGLIFRLLLKTWAAQAHIPQSIQAAWLMFFVLCSPILALISSARVYWEALVWAAAMFTVCVYLSVAALLKTTSLQRWLWFSISCGLALFTRPNTTVGVVLLFGLTLLIARFKFPQLTRLRVLVFSSLVFSVFLILLGTLNYARWGDPLEFAPLHKHIGLIGIEREVIGVTNIERGIIGFIGIERGAKAEKYGNLKHYETERGAKAEKYGNFRLDRVPGAVSYYFLPSADNFKSEKPYAKSGYSNYFPEFEEYIDYREETYPISIAMPIFLVLSLLGTVLLVPQAILCIRRKHELGFVYFIPLALTAWIPGFLLLPLPAQMVRYMGDFFPGIIFFSILASVFLLKCLYTKSERRFIRSPLGQGLHLSVIAGLMVGSFYLLVGTSIYQKILWTVPYDPKFFPFW